MTAQKIDPALLTVLADLKKALSEATTVLGNFTIGHDVDDAPAPVKTRKPAKAKPEPEPEDDEDEDDTPEDPESEYRAELAELDIKGLRKAAIKAGFDKADVDDADAEDIIDALVSDKFGVDDDADEDTDEDEDDDEDSEDEDGEYSRDDLEAMGIRALRALAKDEFEFTTDDLKGLDKDGIIDLILGEDDEDEDDEADDEDVEDEDESDDTEDDEDEEEDDEDDEFEPYTEDELDDLSLADLKAIAKEWGVKVKPGSKQPAYVKAILAAQEDED